MIIRRRNQGVRDITSIPAVVTIVRSSHSAIKRKLPIFHPALFIGFGGSNSAVRLSARRA
jgi:hypothetical protein